MSAITSTSLLGTDERQPPGAHHRSKKNENENEKGGEKYARRQRASGDGKDEEAIQEDVYSTRFARRDFVRPGLEFVELVGHRAGREGVSDDEEHVSDDDERSVAVQIAIPCRFHDAVAFARMR